MKTREVRIDGMSCGHCVMAVQKNLMAVPNLVVESVEIGKAVVRYDENQVTAETIRQAVEKAGYHVQPG
jgi:copper chaperone